MIRDEEFPAFVRGVALAIEHSEGMEAPARDTKPESRSDGRPHSFWLTDLVGES